MKYIFDFRFNTLKTSGYFMYHYILRSEILHSARISYLCVVYRSRKKQRLFPYRTLTD
jgi:hypothetical protein